MEKASRKQTIFSSKPLGVTAWIFLENIALSLEQRVVHVLAVIAVVEGAFLISMYRIVGCVEVQKHPLGGAVLAALLEVKLEEDLGYPVA